MKNEKYYLSKVATYIKKAKTTDIPERREALLRNSQELLNDLSKIVVDNLELKTEVMDLQLELDSIVNQKERFAGIKNFVRNHKKLSAVLASGLILTTGTVGYNAIQNSNLENIAVAATTDKDEDYDTDRFSRDPLAGKNKISEGVAFAEELAKNGAYDKEGYGPEVYALVSVLNTNGAMPNKDKFVENIDLEEYYAKGEVSDGIRSINELVEKVIRAKGTIDWNKIVAHKKSATVLNRAQELYNNVQNGEPTQAQKDEYTKFLNEEVTADLKQYNSFSIMMLTKYLTIAEDSHLINEDQLLLYVTDIDNMCNVDGKNVCEVTNKKGVGAEDTVLSSTKQLALTYLESLLNDKKEHKHNDSEKYYSFAEITSGIKENIKDLKNADIDVEAKGREESIKNIDAISRKKYPGITVNENDPHINHNTGNYESGESIGGDNVGDIVDLPNQDANGNDTDQSIEDMTNYSDIAAADFNNGQYKNEYLYNTQPAYKATWDALKAVYDQNSVPAPGDDNIIDEETDEDEIYYPSSFSAQEMSNENIVLGSDGLYYPAGQLPDGVEQITFDDAISKTR